MAEASFAVPIGKLLSLATLIAPILARAKLRAFVEMLQHSGVVWKPLPTAKHWAFETVSGRHLLRLVALDGGPYYEPVQSALVWFYCASNA